MRAWLAPLALLLVISIPAHAEECVVGDSTPGTIDSPGPHGEVGFATGPIGTNEAHVKGVYAWHDDADQMVTIDGQEFVLAEDVGLWIYAESNDIPGLQRDDYFADDTCGGQVEGDFWIF